MSGSIKPFVSIVIPVYQDWENLMKCLDCLTKQTYPAHRFEVLVVKNDPGSSVPYEIKGSNVFLCEESKVGSYAARNRGIQAAKGEILGFTDSDCQPISDWIAKGVETLTQNPNISRIGGQIAIDAKVYNKRSLVEHYEVFFAFPQEYYVKWESACVTANLFCWKRVFDEVGLFDPNLYSGADIEWGARAQSAGHLIEYASNVVVKHPPRRTFGELKNKARRVAGGQYYKSRHPFLDAHLAIAISWIPPIKMFLRAVGIEGKGRHKAIGMFIHYYLKVLKAVYRLRVAYGEKPERD